MSKFWNTSVLGGHWIYDAFKFCLKYQGTNYFIIFLVIYLINKGKLFHINKDIY
jgi:hypothetical protein